MKKAAVLLLMMFACLMVSSGCSAPVGSEESFAVYSFSGENELFEISNGVIVLSPDEGTFYGGDFKEKQEISSDATEYTMTFYVLSDGSERTLLSNSVVDQTGGTIDISGTTGKISGDILLNIPIDDLNNGLFFKLLTNSSTEGSNEYLLQLDLTEVSKIQLN